MVDNCITNREIKRGDVYWCEFECSAGREQSGRRPVVIVSNDKCNEFSQTVTVIPLTTAVKKKLPTHAIVRASNKTSVALAEHIVTVDKSRICEYINSCSENEMDWIDKCIKIQIGVYVPNYETESFAGNDCIRVISRGYKYFRKTCECCGATYQYTLAHTTDSKSATVCPECGFKNVHSAEFGVECLDD